MIIEGVNWRIPSGRPSGKLMWRLYTKRKKTTYLILNAVFIEADRELGRTKKGVVGVVEEKKTCCHSLLKQIANAGRQASKQAVITLDRC